MSLATSNNDTICIRRDRRKEKNANYQEKMKVLFEEIITQAKESEKQRELIAF